MSRILKYAVALLGLWLIVAVSVFPAGSALWIAFATAIAIAVVAGVDAVAGFAQRRLLSPALATVTAVLGALLVVASLVFENASLAWLMAIAGGAIEAIALSAIGLPSLGRAMQPESREEPRIEAPRVAA